MLELNKVMLVGNLTRDPELSYLPSGTGLAKMGIALNRRYKGRDGDQKEEVSFVDTYYKRCHMAAQIRGLIIWKARRAVKDEPTGEGSNSSSF